MNPERRQSLDEFFAQAEDVLTDWDGSPDAINSAPSACLDFAGALRPPSATEALTLLGYWANDRPVSLRGKVEIYRNGEWIGVGTIVS